MKGADRLYNIFENCRAQRRAALILYYPAGFPDIPQSLNVLEGLTRSGADILEIGMPFSDPLADGPTIQAAAQAALAAGTTTHTCLNAAAQLRRSGVQQGLVMMGYLNPIVTYGMERWVQDAAAAGVDGVILPDLPPEESDEFQSLCEAYGLANIFLISPATPIERARRIAERAKGFIYLVSLTGVTGARQHLPEGLQDFIRRSRQLTTLPLAVGFGISTPEQARLIGRLADGVIIGSALIDAVRRAQDPLAAAVEFAQTMRAALEEVAVV
jgi:tryptophan synthase alpha chain